MADICPCGHNVEIEAQISAREAEAVGLAIRSDISRDTCGGNNLFFLMEKENGTVRATRPQLFSDPFVRKWKFPVRERYRARVCARPPWYKFYVEDDLVLQFNLDIEITGIPGVGLFVDRGCAEISDLTIYGL